MLTIQKRRRIWPVIIIAASLVIVLVGLYIAALFNAPAFGALSIKPINTESMESPKAGDNRIIIPKIGVDLAYDKSSETSPTDAAAWLHSELGNPIDGGNFVVTARGFALQSTIQETIDKSPFYNITKLSGGDQILVDYEGKRFLYTIEKNLDDTTAQEKIKTVSDTPKLTLYSSKADGESDGRSVVTAFKDGEVATKTKSK